PTPLIRIGWTDGPTTGTAAAASAPAGGPSVLAHGVKIASGAARRSAPRTTCRRAIAAVATNRFAAAATACVQLGDAAKATITAETTTTTSCTSDGSCRAAAQAAQAAATPTGVSPVITEAADSALRAVAAER